MEQTWCLAKKCNSLHEKLQPLPKIFRKLSGSFYLDNPIGYVASEYRSVNN